MSMKPSFVDLLLATNPAWRGAFEDFSTKQGKPLAPGSDPARHIFAIGGGLVSVRYDSGHAVALGGSGSILGCHALFSAGTMPLGVHAETDVTGLRAPVATARSICDRCPDSRRIFEALDQALTFEIALNLRLALQHKTQARTAFYLLKAREALGNALPLTHARISAMSGIRRASVTTDLNAFAREGAVGLDRGVVDILRRPLLTAAVGPGWDELERLAALAGSTPGPVTTGRPLPPRPRSRKPKAKAPFPASRSRGSQVRSPVREVSP